MTDLNNFSPREIIMLAVRNAAANLNFTATNHNIYDTENHIYHSNYNSTLFIKGIRVFEVLFIKYG